MDSEEIQKLQEEIQKVTETGDASGLISSWDGFLGPYGFWTLVIGFVVSVFGWWIFKQGRKKANFGLIGIGITMMVYPYFVTNPWLCFLTGAALGFGALKIWNR